MVRWSSRWSEFTKQDYNQFLSYLQSLRDVPAEGFSLQEELNSLVEMAMVWRRRGYSLIPCQPDSKRILRSFGLFQKRVEDSKDVNFWFRDRNCNLAVICPEKAIILDFDRIEVYNEFTALSPDLAKSYTEFTPRGGRHVFLNSTSIIKPGMAFVSGIEVKRFCLVFPSRVSGSPYGISNPAPILSEDVLKGISRFLIDHGENNAASPKKVASSFHKISQVEKNDKIGILEELKKNWPILDYLQFFEPNLVLRGNGRFLSGLCPWHDDRHPSLWVDTDLDQWGCHACKKFGDVVNWHALRLHTSNIGTAVHDLAEYKIRFSATEGER